MIRRSQRLRHLDIRNVLRLVREITERGRDPQVWRSHMLQNLLPMIGARVGLALEHYIRPENPYETMLVGLVDLGWTPDERATFFDFIRSGGFANDPMRDAVSRLLFRSFTRRRIDMISDEIWYSAPLVNDLRKRINVDDQIYARCLLPHRGWAATITLMRSWGQTRFGVRERLVVSLLNREMGRLWNQVDTGPLASLPPRLRQTLDLIFNGYSEKEMAHTLNVSAHTLHDFARRLYRHFNVNGRSRLLTDPDCRRLLLRPALSPAYYLADRQVSDASFHGRTPDRSPPQGD